MSEERVIHSEPIYQGRVVNLRVDTIERSDGRTFDREIIQHSGAVAMVAIDDNGDVLLVRQQRSGAGKRLLELPAGGLEPDEARIDCARRELQEEVGYYPESLLKLGGYFVAASYTTEFITIFLARSLRPSELPGDEDEEIEVVRLPFTEALRMALDAEIEDSKTVIGLTWAARHFSLG